MNEGSKVLDVGSGSGYLVSCMAHMVCNADDHCIHLTLVVKINVLIPRLEAPV